MYAEVTTKDGNRGLIVVAETIGQLLDECASWVRDNKVRPDEVSESSVLDAVSKNIIGKLFFAENDTVLCLPAV